MAICYAALMVPEPSIFEIDEEAEATADAEGMADIAAGRVVPHEEVAAWLDTWGTSDEQKFTRLLWTAKRSVSFFR